ncbi:12347_t:CDS:2 [Gigaspora margarita]|uniref:12347_t:CDS:1 n=1 Tax=Gigaspora margarita TaxID=4874 RepID=A0ABN7UHJ2_GIGMA|nr:12347_t:CDS:2 [Gigaspora margarita]
MRIDIYLITLIQRTIIYLLMDYFSSNNLCYPEGNVFEEIDEGEEVLVGNKRTVFEENEVGVLEDSEEENEGQVISAADEQFQNMFAENGFKIYEHRELVEIELPKKTEAEKAAENRRSIVNELIERTKVHTGK